MGIKSLKHIDTDKLLEDINKVVDSIGAPTQKDMTHIRHIHLITTMFLLIGIVSLGAAFYTNILWIAPITGLFLALWENVKWAAIAHPVMHEAYDSVCGSDDRFNSKKFGRGWRKWLDFPGTLLVDSWTYEHNLHHEFTSTLKDPDNTLDKFTKLKRSTHGKLYRYIVILYFVLTWKISYFAKQNILVYNHYHKNKLSFFWDSLFPHYAPILVILTALAVVTTHWWVAILFFVSFEIFLGVSGFILLAGNHVGGDIYRVDVKDTDNILTHFVTSADYNYGGTLKNMFLGYLCFHVEHHLIIDRTNLFYTNFAPKLELIAKKYDIPYIKTNVFGRIPKAFSTLAGYEKGKRVIL